MHNSENENQKQSAENWNDQQDETLSSLWQAQPVKTINLDEVKANLHSERKKQRWYMVLDSLMVLPAIYILMKYWGNMSGVAQMMFVFMLSTSLPLLVYQLWLRRVAAFSKNSQTADHLMELTKQIKNNVKIAFMTKHSTWIALVFGFAFVLEHYFSGDLVPEKNSKLIIAVSSMSIGMLIWYIWAHKRQKHFECQLETLENLAQHR